MMRGTERILMIALTLGALSMAGAATAETAGPEIYLKDGGVYAGGWEYALDGYDVVAYFDRARAVKGTDVFVTEYKGVLWLFSSEENLNKFREEPEKYLPQFGGYCAWSVAKGHLAPGDPRVWAIHGGKLYIIGNRGAKKRWDRNRDSFIAMARINWPGVLEKQPPNLSRP